MLVAFRKKIKILHYRRKFEDKMCQIPNLESNLLSTCTYWQFQYELMLC